MTLLPAAPGDTDGVIRVAAPAELLQHTYTPKLLLVGSTQGPHMLADLLLTSACMYQAATFSQ